MCSSDLPAISQSRIDKVKLEKKLKADEIDTIIEKTKARGAEIVSLFGKGSAYYAPSAAVFKMVKAVAEDRNEILPCSCFLNGEYGIKDIYLGVPAKIGKSGVNEIVEVELSEEEKGLLKQAADSVASQIKSLRLA